MSVVKRWIYMVRYKSIDKYVGIMTLPFPWRCWHTSQPHRLIFFHVSRRPSMVISVPFISSAFLTCSCCFRSCSLTLSFLALIFCSNLSHFEGEQTSEFTSHILLQSPLWNFTEQKVLIASKHLKPETKRGRIRDLCVSVKLVFFLTIHRLKLPPLWVCL